MVSDVGVLVIVLGESGTGKSTSLRNFGADEVGVFNVASKPLPFRNSLKRCDGARYQTINATLNSNALRAYVVDDAGYLMQFDNFAKAKETGYGKYVDMALAFEQMVESAIATDRDTVTYLLMHPDYDVNGRMKPKTIGKMLDEKLCIEGLSPIVLVSFKDEQGYHFKTNGDPGSPAKSPMGMFDEVIDNDLKFVDTTLREYWGMASINKDSSDKKED